MNGNIGYWTWISCEKFRDDIVYLNTYGYYDDSGIFSWNLTCELNGLTHIAYTSELGVQYAINHGIKCLYQRIQSGEWRHNFDEIDYFGWPKTGKLYYQFALRILWNERHFEHWTLIHRQKVLHSAVKSSKVFQFSITWKVIFDCLQKFSHVK